MNILDKLEKRLGGIGIPNLTYILIAGQILAFILLFFNPPYAKYFVLNGAAIYHGEYWRIITFLFQPLTISPIFAAFAWYLYYLYGRVLENKWGDFRYTLYILVAYICALIPAFIFPAQTFDNWNIFTTLFLAFAYLFPDFRLSLFFIIPIKIKWLGYLIWVGIGISILFGTFPSRVATLLSVLNFVIFFGEDVYMSIRYRGKVVTKPFIRVVEHKKAHHICAVCKRNEVENPEMEILYCSDCHPSLCYCERHFGDHTHRIEKN